MRYRLRTLLSQDFSPADLIAFLLAIWVMLPALILVAVLSPLLLAQWLYGRISRP